MNRRTAKSETDTPLGAAETDTTSDATPGGVMSPCGGIWTGLGNDGSDLGMYPNKVYPRSQFPAASLDLLHDAGHVQFVELAKDDGATPESSPSFFSEPDETPVPIASSDDSTPSEEAI